MSRTVWVNGSPFPSRYAGLVEEDIDISWEYLWTISPKIFAVHEAGHAVAAMAGGYAVNFTEVEPRPRYGHGGMTGVRVDEGRPLPPVAFYAAGERAADRWLREQGLWTVQTAVVNEASAFADRKSYDWETAHDCADELLDQHWGSVLAVADQLVGRGHLTGADVTSIVGNMNMNVEIS